LGLGSDKYAKGNLQAAEVGGVRRAKGGERKKWMREEGYMLQHGTWNRERSRRRHPDQHKIREKGRRGS
jgi:hypothetical protein